MKKSASVLLLLVAVVFVVRAQSIQEGLKALDFERYEHARNLFKTLTAAEPGKGENYYYLGQSYMYLLRDDSAMIAYTEGIKADPNSPYCYIGVGELHLNDNKVADAKAQFDKALSFSKGKDARVLSMVAEAMVNGETKLPDEALNHINQALEIDKKNYEVLIAAGDVMLERNEGGPAATFYEKAIDLDKKNPKAYTRVAGIWLRVRNAEATFNELTRALAIDSNYAPALKSLAEYYYQTRKFEKAKATYIRYLQNSEESTANKIRFARILFKSKEYEETIGKIEEIQRTDKSDVYLYRLAGYSYYEAGMAKNDSSRFRSGVAAMETFFAKADPRKILPSDVEYYGKLLAKTPGREMDALTNLNKALTMDSTKVDIYLDIATVNNNLKKYGDAASNYEIYMSKKKNPSLLDYYKMGNTYYANKDFVKMDSTFSRLSQLKPDYAAAYYMRGLANASLDPEFKSTLAKEFYEKFISMTESAPDKNKKNLIGSYDYLGTYYVQHDDNETAKVYYNKILALDPENKRAKDTLKLLNQPQKPKK